MTRETATVKSAPAASRAAYLAQVFRNTGEASIIRHPSSGRLSDHLFYWLSSTGSSFSR
ncbi:MAG: hypothetical protein ACLSIQ_09430 [Akkermansia sp.]